MKKEQYDNLVAEVKRMLALSDQQRSMQFGTDGWKLLVRKLIDNSTLIQ